MEARASEILLLLMAQKDSTNGATWSTGKEGSPVPITVAGSFDGFRGNGVHIFARDASHFELQSK